MVSLAQEARPPPLPPTERALGTAQGTAPGEGSEQLSRTHGCGQQLGGQGQLHRDFLYSQLRETLLGNCGGTCAPQPGIYPTRTRELIKAGLRPGYRPGYREFTKEDSTQLM